MAAGKVPGPQGLGLRVVETFRLPNDIRRGAVPGPVGLRRCADKGGSGGGHAATAKPRAVIIIGAGQDDIKLGVRHADTKHFDQAARETFGKYFGAERYAVTVKHVKSPKEMTAALEKGGPW